MTVPARKEKIRSTEAGKGEALNEDITSEQHEVQRKLGRCLLRLQQYEGLLKAVAAHQDTEGPADSLQAIRDSRVEELSTKILGHVVGE